MRVLFTSKNLIGDTLYISEPLREWIKLNHPKEVFMLTLKDHITPLYKGMVRDIFPDLKVVHERPEGTFDFEHVFDVNKAFQVSDQYKCHIAESYAKLLGIEIKQIGPTYIPEKLDFYNEGDVIDLHQCILVSMFSASDASRGNPPQAPNKMIPWEKWKVLINRLREAYPDTKIRFLGAPTDFVPDEDDNYSWDIVKPGEYMLGIPLNKLAWIMRSAKLLVTIDNGMGHLGASQSTPTFIMYPRCLGLHYILPVGNQNMLSFVHMEPNLVPAGQLLHGLNYAIKRLEAK